MLHNVFGVCAHPPFFWPITDRNGGKLGSAKLLFLDPTKVTTLLLFQPARRNHRACATNTWFLVLVGVGAGVGRIPNGVIR